MAGKGASGSSTESPPVGSEEGKHDHARMHIGSLHDVKGTSEHFKHLRPSALQPFFGSNEPEPIPAMQAERKEHPCAGYSRQVHRCLDSHNNDFTLCQTSVAAFNQCLNELGDNTLK